MHNAVNDSGIQRYAPTPVCVITELRSLVVSKLLTYKVRNQVTFNCLYVTALDTQRPHNSGGMRLT